ncbi:MAG: Gfo/Idh/MocA family oxidoreductase [Acidobacteria bacterium]|nr:Gfo/Idh/MocA family oxidoreductase [Acidobacteriota bacterium]
MPHSRRHFIGSAAAAAAGVSSMAQTARPRSANDTIQIALIGAGGMGTADAISSLAVGGTKIVAVADIYDGRIARAKERWGNDLFSTRDYREVLARKDVDAVIIGTPDHWHQKISIDAMDAGKDVYCEKPMVQKVEQGKAVIEAQARNKRIFQVGSQRVSSIVYQKAKDLIKAGAIGEVNLIEAWWDRNSAIGAWQYSIPPDASPENIDWDRFLGSAPKRPFEPIRLFRWRNYKDYGTGVCGDLFVHLFSGMHHILETNGPTRIFSTGGLRFWNDGRDVPDIMVGLYDYPATAKQPAFNLSLRVNFVSGNGGSSGFRFVGSEGVIMVDDGVTISRPPREVDPGLSIGTFSEKIREEVTRQHRAKYPVVRPNADSMRARDEDKYLPPPGYSDHLDHHRNFIEAVRSRKPVIEDATFGLRAAGPAVLSNVSYDQKKTIEWDPQTMTVKG